MNYQKLHKFLLALGFCIVIAVVVGASFIFDIAIQVGAVVLLLALLWIGWELHRIAQMCFNFLSGMEDGIRGTYQRPE
jgi:hypothetical protein